jgi:hypothetical protein
MVNEKRINNLIIIFLDNAEEFDAQNSPDLHPSPHSHQFPEDLLIPEDLGMEADMEEDLDMEDGDLHTEISNSSSDNAQEVDSPNLPDILHPSPHSHLFPEDLDMEAAMEEDLDMEDGDLYTEISDSSSGLFYQIC